MSELVATGKQGPQLQGQQVALVQQIVAGMSHKEAGIAAGYSSFANTLQAIRSPAVQAALKTARVDRLRGDLAFKALKTMEDLITSDKTPAATRLAASKWVLEQAGHRDQADDDRDVPLHEMTADQLARFMAKAQAVVDQGGDAPIITVTPDNGA